MTPQLAHEVVAAKCAHLTPVEMRVARMRLGVVPEDIEGPPVGLLVGEAPPAAMGTCLPLFPYPARSTAGRLLRFSGMPVGVYLGRFFRRNLFDEYQPWSVPAARARADVIREWLMSLGSMRIVLCGAKVGEAFGLDGFFKPRDEHFPDGEGGVTHEYVAIPHPSGNNRLYNSSDVQRAAQAALVWAAGL